jgi:cell division protease FtsH
VAAGHQLRRGLLLHGPPGTGKTYTIMYLCNRMPGRTTILLAGVGDHALGRAVALARRLQPSMVVLEDVDLVALERSHATGQQPLLFQLLNEMDGLDADADIVFVLTTNRPELLEPALAQRPGRVDLAVEISLPDADRRRRLLERYFRDTPTDGLDLERFVAPTEGVPASFVKELSRRALVGALSAGEHVVTSAHVDAALADLVARQDALRQVSGG